MTGTTVTDPRVGPVEDNLVDFTTVLASMPGIGTDDQPDALTYFCDVPFPLYNGVVAARFPADRAAERTRAVLGPFLERGLPFSWVATPSHTSPGIEAALVEAGLEVDVAPGMHRRLDGPDPDVALTPGLEIRRVGPGDHDRLLPVLFEVFGFPDFAQPMMTRAMTELPTDRMSHVLATVDGEPVGGGTLWLHGRVAGLYNIAVLEPFRGRGIGYAVTATLLDLARERGCTEAVLHSSDLGRSVYERLGFVEVCQVPQYVWSPE
ncbi:GNAT family N-acetyltransferase [Nocardioides sp. GCM10027113]|uniref:GNAT family N-acetyltransferase n=1 Tax=unclassified Nocardioides TaxID=2615069 RepID=UPI00361F5D19